LGQTNRLRICRVGAGRTKDATKPQNDIRVVGEWREEDAPDR
jgi:hypothetical protein